MFKLFSKKDTTADEMDFDADVSLAPQIEYIPKPVMGGFEEVIERLTILEEKIDKILGDK